MDSLKAISWLSWKRNCLGNEWSLVILVKCKIQDVVFRDYQKNK